MATRTSGTVAKALDLLDRIVEREDECTVTELAGATGIHKSTVVRLCATLAGRGYLGRGPRGGFRLGARVADLARVYRGQFDLEDIVRPTLAGLRDATEESASFYRIDGDARICLFREDSNHSIRHHVDEGTRLPLRDGVVGRVLLAFSGARGMEYEAIREAGYLDDEGREPDTASLAAPVIGTDGALAGAIVVSGPATRFTSSRRRKAREEIIKTCNDINIY